MKQNIAEFFAQLSKALDSKAHIRNVLRYGVAADFTSQEEIEYLKQLAAAHSDYTIYAYTKERDFDYSDLPDNLVIRASQWIGEEVWGDDMPKAWYQDGTETRIPADAFTCRNTSKNKLTCAKCKKCWKSKKDVVLNAH